MNLEFMRTAISLGYKGMSQNEGGPFGCVVVRNGTIIGKGWNSVLRLNDPTAHAEIMAIRDACKHLGSFQLTDCDIYTSCEPCPMCLGAIYWARPKVVYYASTRLAAKEIGFDDDYIYSELRLPINNRSIEMKHLESQEANELFLAWKNKTDKSSY